MRVLVCGGRRYRDESNVYKTLDRLHALHGFTVVIHGACGDNADNLKGLDSYTGADRYADIWAHLNQVDVIACPAHWTRDGKFGGPKRNAGMIANYNPQLVVAFPGGNGTNGMLRLAAAAGIPTLRTESGCNATSAGEQLTLLPGTPTAKR